MIQVASDDRCIFYSLSIKSSAFFLYASDRGLILQKAETAEPNY